MAVRARHDQQRPIGTRRWVCATVQATAGRMAECAQPCRLPLFRPLARRGNADAQRRMAYRRLVGRGIEADPEGAFHDFQAAAAQGDPYAIFNVGYMHLRVGVGQGQVTALVRAPEGRCAASVWGLAADVLGSLALYTGCVQW